jgi:beta-phosphoglucomutase
MLEAVIFDMDGVVIDSHPVHKRSWKLFLESVGKQVSDNELDYVLEGTKREEILRHFLGELGDDQIRDFGLRKEVLFRQQAIHMQPISGFMELLKQITDSGLCVAVASSGSKSRVTYILEHLGVRHHFGAVVTGDDVKNGKPDPSIFKLAAERLDVSAEAALVVEDSVAGVRGAKAAGMRCLGIAQGHRANVLLNAGADDVLVDFQGVDLSKLKALHRGSTKQNHLIETK